jgi:3-deoxy-7-phosphoheptulonate synthase
MTCRLPSSRPGPTPPPSPSAVATLATYPPLVFAGECDVLKARMAAAARGEAFVLQGGDCAETFAGASADNIKNRVKTILQMAAVLTYGASVPVVKVGRMAGQYAKPRSSDVETRDGVTLPAYRGDMVNDYDFSAPSREPDPQRLVRGYHASSATLNLVRAFTTGGFADLRYVHDWNKGFVANAANARYEKIARDIDKAMKFMAACGADFEAMKTTEFFAAHEALLLDYERPLVRTDSRTGELYEHLGALPLGRGAHPRPGRRAHRLRLAHSQPDRRQGLRRRRCRRPAADDRRTRPDSRAGAPDLHHAHGCRPDP